MTDIMSSIVRDRQCIDPLCCPSTIYVLVWSSQRRSMRKVRNSLGECRRDHLLSRSRWGRKGRRGDRNRRGSIPILVTYGRHLNGLCHPFLKMKGRKEEQECAGLGRKAVETELARSSLSVGNFRQTTAMSWLLSTSRERKKGFLMSALFWKEIFASLYFEIRPGSQQG